MLANRNSRVTRLNWATTSAAALFVLAFASTTRAQWVTFQNETATRLNVPSGLGSADPQEKDYAFADLDQDGDIDLVCVRKEPFTTTGRFPNVLMMNENGVLTDRTTLYASFSTVAGSQGFLDSTNDRDVVIADVNGDGWLDLVTATTLSGTQPKYISHPRVYINRGDDINGNWLGFIFDDENRIPTLPAEPRFCSVSAGDIDGDGDVDLYMGDYQQGGSRPVDLNDRLFINNGSGYFTDESSLRMTTEMLESSFAMETAIVDLNGDGRKDILKDDALNAPQAVSVSYNGLASAPGATHGNFNSYQLIYQITAYNFEVGDLNNDNIPDLIISDDGQDRYQLGGPLDAQGRRTFQPNQAFTYQGSSDDGFGGNNIIADLDNDGFPEALIADVDVDAPGFNRRMHIFRNLANAPNVTMQEQVVSGAVASIPTSQLTATYDVAPFDINGDGFIDLVIGRSVGTSVWMNVPPTGASFSGPINSFIAPDTSLTITRTITPTGATVINPSSVTLHWRVNGGTYTPASMASIGGNTYSVALGNVLPECFDRIEYYFTASSMSGQNFADPAMAPAVVHSGLAATGMQTLLEEHFEGLTAPGWQVQNTSVTGGAWVQVVPVGATNSGQISAPFTDSESGAQFTRCFVTGNGTSGQITTPGAADVDGGPTILLSPIMNLAGSDAIISYARWFYTSVTGTPDALLVQVSNNLSTWVTVENVTTSGSLWTNTSFRVSDFVVPSATVRVRFSISDNPNDSITEAGVDNFRAEQFLCTICQPSVGFQGPGNLHMSVCGQGAFASGNTADLVITGATPGTIVILIADAALNPTPIFGGTVFNPNPALILTIQADLNGEASILGIPGGNGPYTVYVQAAEVVPGGVTFSETIQINAEP